ncbi:ribose 5-phosphate isomerase B [Pedobacter caeni]|uniref:Ribose 5-phosphate isomerase B n=1 Tax=Pedobacter caeni TaxID=288992 RepID=A0A1M5NSC2_9SPHI|nr:ribose 5-phosphate isomerase B [Pedobacter caeni]SHG92367.1 ribose 5-phosphate isomerase B [Pedobacter caeni]
MSTETKIKIAIGADHAGFEYKELLKSFLTEYEVKDFGTHSTQSVDYPDFAHPVASAVESKEYTFGILVCGSANGVAITANKHQHIRAAICWLNEIAELARMHNNANILCIPARFVSEDLAKEMTTTFLNTPFEGGRHEGRVNKISC